MKSIISTFSLLLFLFIVFPVLSTRAQCDTSCKKTRLLDINKPHSHTSDYNRYLKNSRNELEATAALLFIFYKNYLSSQDMNSCVFTPSCSVYAIECLQKNNPVEAYLKIFDRLQRCHPIVTPGEYPYNQQSERHYDPVH